MTARSMMLLFATMAMVAIMAGCGSSGDSTAITESSITKAEFIKKVNAICEQGKGAMTAELIALQKRLAKTPDKDMAEAAAQEIMRPSMRDQVEEIRSLGAPRGDAGQIEAFTASLLRAVDRIVREGRFKTEETLPVLRPVGDLALKYGINECAYGH